MMDGVLGFLDNEMNDCQDKKVIVKTGGSHFSTNTPLNSQYTPNESSLASLPPIITSNIIKLQDNSIDNPLPFNFSGKLHNNNSNSNQLVKKQNIQEIKDEKIDHSGNGCNGFRVYCGEGATVEKNDLSFPMRDPYEVIFKDGIITYRTYVPNNKHLNILIRVKNIKDPVVVSIKGEVATVQIKGPLEMVLDGKPAPGSTKDGIMIFRSSETKFIANYMSQLKGFGIDKVTRSQGSINGANGTMYDTINKSYSGVASSSSGSTFKSVGDLSVARMDLERLNNIKPPVLKKVSTPLDTSARNKINTISSSPSPQFSDYYPSRQHSRRDGIPLPDELLSVSPIATRIPRKPKLHVDGDEVMIIYPEKEENSKSSQVKIIRNDIKRLDPGEFLNDSIIEFYSLYIKDKFLTEVQRSKCFFFNSFFYKKFTNKTNAEDAYQEIKKWTGQEDIFEKDFIFVPINQSAHWSMMILCYPGVVRDANDPSTKRSCMIYLDSLFKTANSFAVRLRKYLTLEWQNKKVKEGIVEPRVFDGSNYPHHRPHVPQQNNGTDCGVYLLQYLELFCKTPETNFKFPLERPEWFTQADIRRKRIEIRKLIYQIRESQFPLEKTLQEEEKFDIIYTSNLGGYQLGSGSGSLSPNSSSLEIIEEIPTPCKSNIVKSFSINTIPVATTSKTASTKIDEPETVSYDKYIKNNNIATAYDDDNDEGSRDAIIEKRTFEMLGETLTTFTGIKKPIPKYDDDGEKEKQIGSGDEDKSSNKVKSDLDVEGKTINTNDQKNLLDEFSSVNINKEEEEDKEEKPSTTTIKKPTELKHAKKRLFPSKPPPQQQKQQDTVTVDKKVKSDVDFTTSGSDVEELGADKSQKKRDQTKKRSVRLPSNSATTSKRSRDSDEDNKQKKKKSLKSNNNYYDDELSVPPVSKSEKKAYTDIFSLSQKTVKSIGGLSADDLDDSITVDED